MKDKSKQSIVYTNTAKCRDCYRCLRVCPVNAIKMENGQAMVIPENCIACGSCIPECPQQAKTYVKNTDEVIKMLSEKEDVLLSIAPSFATVYSKWERKRLPSALRQAGFSVVSETAIGAYQVAKKTAKIIGEKTNSSHICSSCPAVVNYIEKYSKDEIRFLVPIVSPMIAHARMLRIQHKKNCKIVFVGPCVAKKDEAARPEFKNIIDAVLTFEELNNILNEKKINLLKCEESDFDNQASGYSKLFPLENGLLETAGISSKSAGNPVFSMSGFKDVSDAINTIHETSSNYIIEPLFCSSGCINGPVVKPKNLLNEKKELIEYFNEKAPVNEPIILQKNLSTRFSKKDVLNEESFSEREVEKVLKSTGKLSVEDELNCAACGYNSCREKAIAVLNGIAEIEMCIPFMRRLAEQKSDKLIQSDPNGVIILNHKLEIISMNPAFKKMFSCSDNLIGENISYLIDPEPFEMIVTKKESKYNDIAKYQSYNLVCHQICYPIEEEKQLVGIFVDITDTQSSKEKLRDIKTETILQAQELMEHQVEMAQELARFIGNHTAKGEMLMNHLIKEIGK